MKTTETASHSERILLTVEEAAKRLRIGRTTAYRLLADGQIASIQIGHLRRVPVEALTAFVRNRRVAANHGWRS
ncbi:MAG: helix-turn-helix domain-containing protein [Sporichthyaceae bacterium]